MSTSSSSIPGMQPGIAYTEHAMQASKQRWRSARTHHFNQIDVQIDAHAVRSAAHQTDDGHDLRAV